MPPRRFINPCSRRNVVRLSNHFGVFSSRRPSLFVQLRTVKSSSFPQHSHDNLICRSILPSYRVSVPKTLGFMEKPRHLARRVTRVGVVDTIGRAGIHRDDRRAGASLGRSAPLGVAMADDSEVQPLLTRAAKDAAGRADESSSGRVSRAKGACASHREPRTRRSRAIGSVRCLSTRGELARDAHAHGLG